MRGLPASGKSTRARELAAGGPVFSTDDFWYEVVKPEKPHEYSFNQRLLGEAHRWNKLRAWNAVENNSPLVVVDNTNTTGSECKVYVEYALPQGYEVAVEEPTSPWWLEIRQLLYDKRVNKDTLKRWAVDLAERSKGIHDVPFFAIEKMMWRWECDLTVEDILAAPDMK